MKIDFIFDVVCPWCYIGKRRLEQALALRPGVMPEINYRPFLLNPQLPAEGIDHDTYLSGKFGSERRISRIYDAISEVGQSVDIHFKFDDIDRAPNTLDAHRMISLAADAGRAGEVVEALYGAYFLDGLNIGDTDVLVDIGINVGLNGQVLREYLQGDDGKRAVFDNNAQIHRLGVNGVPSFIFGPLMIISGAQDEVVLVRVIDAAIAAEKAA
ncbi:MAG: DsbA family oxidoreductase [Rhodospirillaceae bacterium]|jgi:predicted DsbA family dithiol-disulfide isomerase|nr:DsbA family oxidoreductase [Rhodospirillaceae bacterium]MBT5014213.1 DsbA family oxidoreductase [Rhodospirillaceae bacterium]MBT5308064.1 DsbA family oxidoreductase [Rhodospirillaceae bacterium]MBT7357021.1 DsbA family oxidoreductase [Rhodospirillaceae bacterium]